MAVGLPCGGDDVGHLGAVEQGAWCDGEFAVTFIDGIHDAVDLLASLVLFRRIGKEVELLPFGCGIEGADLGKR